MKPFNPILGETFEINHQNFKYFAEQVSHHPPISACYAESEHYSLWFNSGMKINFWGKSLEVKPTSLQHIRLKATNEHFIIERPSAYLSNIIIGELYTEMAGIMVVKNVTTKESCEIEFKRKSWSGMNF